MNEQPALTLREAYEADVLDAAALLTRARFADPDQQLLGSCTAMATGPLGVTEFAEILTIALQRGRVDVAVAGGQLVGVACWISHPTGRPRTAIPSSSAELPHRPRRFGPVADLLARLRVLDMVMNVPLGPTHDHLACLGTRPGYGARSIADLLLDHRGMASDRGGRTVYTEIHELVDRDRLSRRGYHNLGICRGEHTDQPSYLMTRNTSPPAL